MVQFLGTLSGLMFSKVIASDPAETSQDTPWFSGSLACNVQPYCNGEVFN